MKIVCDSPGQTCNRLWSYVPVLSERIVKNKRMILLFFDETIEDFPHFLHSKYVYFPLYWHWYLHHGNGWNNFKGLTWKLCHDKTWEKFWIATKCHYGWHHRGETAYIAEAKPVLQQIFTPADDILARCEQAFAPYRGTDHLMVGVHIRRGDYKTWNDGKFYFENDVYCDYMKQVAALFPDKHVHFYISTNVKIDYADFPCLDIVKIPGAGVVDDLHALSQCDYIIGPVSTFSRWASFIGEKPLCFLYPDLKQITKESFSVVTSFYRFENGTEILDW